MSCVDSLCRCFQNAIAKVEAGEDDGWAFADTLGCVFLFAYLVLYHLWAGFKIRKAIRKDANYWVKKKLFSFQSENRRFRSARGGSREGGRQRAFEGAHGKDTDRGGGRSSRRPPTGGGVPTK